jgi:hypothetical protein
MPTHLPRSQVLIWGTAICCLASLSILPIVLLESSSLLSPEAIRSEASHVKQATGASVHHLMDLARQIRQHPLELLLRKSKKENAQNPILVSSSSLSLQQQQQQQSHPAHKQQANVHVKRSKEPPALTLDDLKAAVTTGTHGGDDAAWYQRKMSSVARGVAGLAGLDQTPAVVGARRAHVDNCPMNVDSLTYWNDPVGTRDQAFRTPFASSSSTASTKKKDNDKSSNSRQRKYITFAPDRGGWNNVRVLMYICRFGVLVLSV